MEIPQNTGFLKQPNRWNRIKTDATGGPGGPVTPPPKSNSKTFPFSVSGFARNALYLLQPRPTPLPPVLGLFIYAWYAAAIINHGRLAFLSLILVGLAWVLIPFQIFTLLDC